MIWGLVLEPGQQYLQVVEAELQLKMAALESRRSHGEWSQNYVQVIVETATGVELIMCTLAHGVVLQQNLDLKFVQGEKVRFSVDGGSRVHLTGYTPDIPAAVNNEGGLQEMESDNRLVAESHDSGREGVSSYCDEKNQGLAPSVHHEHMTRPEEISEVKREKFSCRFCQEQLKEQSHLEAHEKQHQEEREDAGNSSTIKTKHTEIFIPQAVAIDLSDKRRLQRLPSPTLPLDFSSNRKKSQSISVMAEAQETPRVKLRRLSSVDSATPSVITHHASTSSRTDDGMVITKGVEFVSKVYTEYKQRFTGAHPKKKKDLRTMQSCPSGVVEKTSSTSPSCSSSPAEKRPSLENIVIECAFCDKNFSNRDLFEGRVRQHQMQHFRVCFKCKHCTKEFADVGELKEHEETHRDGSGQVEDSQSQASSAPNITMKRVHLEPLTSNVGKKVSKGDHIDLITCMICSQPFVNPTLFEEHMLSHASVTTFDCKYCSMPFTSDLSRDIHQYIHNNQQYSCCFCGAAFPDQRMSTIHKENCKNRMRVLPHKIPDK